MRKVITYGTFDLLHAGHINLLRRAKELGDYLIVVVSTDEFNWNEKQKKCYFSYEERKKLVEAVRYVDLVIPEENWDQKISDVKEYHVDTFVMGDDWKELGDYLIVVVSTDEFNWNEKQKKCYFSYEERKKLVEAVRYVDLVIPEENWDQKISDVKEYHVDTFVMGDDWKGKFDFLKDYCEVVYLPRTEGISTTKIKQDLGLNGTTANK